MDHLNTAAKHTIDTVAGATILSSFAGWLPMVLAIPAAVWYCIQIYEYLKKKRAAQ